MFSTGCLAVLGPWPVFNLADAALVVGAGMIVLTALGGHA
jgi:lipoprotein signal peptidase